MATRPRRHASRSTPWPATRAEATAAVTDAMVDELTLVGPVARVAERLQAYRDAGVTTLLAQTTDVDTIRAVAEAAERGGVA